MEFLNTARQNEREIEAALGSDEISAAVMPSHNLRGGALAVGAHALAQAAGAMEAAARISDGARCRDLLAPLARELQRAADDVGG
jgi:HPt (histidine-containing phosphotransfer) domain-containing protein